MRIHIGKLFSELLQKQRISKTEFANSLHYSKQNINSLLKKEHWNSETIYKASEILNANLFLQLSNCISPQDKEENILQKTSASYKKEIQYLKEINELLKKTNARK